MWNVKSNTSDDFLYNQAYDLGHLDPISGTWSSAQNTLKQV